jgi:hypothetical protein
MVQIKKTALLSAVFNILSFFQKKLNRTALQNMAKIKAVKVKCEAVVNLFQVK